MAAQGGGSAGIYSRARRTVAATILGFLSGYSIGTLVADAIGLDCWDARRADWLASQDWRGVTSRMISDAMRANNTCITDIAGGPPAITVFDPDTTALPSTVEYRNSWENTKRFLAAQGAENMIALREVPRFHFEYSYLPDFIERRMYASDELRLAHAALLECVVLRERFLPSADAETDDDSIRKDFTPTFSVPRAD
jgi:hypothetical protein